MNDLVSSAMNNPLLYHEPVLWRAHDPLSRICHVFDCNIYVYWSLYSTMCTSYPICFRFHSFLFSVH
jgi:hypothetical protein